MRILAKSERSQRAPRSMPAMLVITPKEITMRYTHLMTVKNTLFVEIRLAQISLKDKNPKRQVNANIPKHRETKRNTTVLKPVPGVSSPTDATYLGSLITSIDVMKCFDDAQKRGSHLLKADEAQRKKIAGLFSEYEQITDTGEFGEAAYRDTLIMQLLILIGRLSFSNSKRNPGLYDSKIEQALTYINENIGKDGLTIL